MAISQFQHNYSHYIIIFYFKTMYSFDLYGDKWIVFEIQILFLKRIQSEYVSGI